MIPEIIKGDPKVNALAYAFQQRALELSKLKRDWTEEEKRELLELQKAYDDELDAHYRREDRKARRLAKGGTWAE